MNLRALTLSSSMLLATLITPLAAHADPFSSQGRGASPLQPLPAIPCAGPWCDAVYGYIQAYNSYAHTINTINTIAEETKTYPQSVSTNFSSDMQKIASIVSESKSINDQVSGVEKQVSQLWPNYSPGTPLASLNHTLNTRTATSIIALLKSSGMLTQQSTNPDQMSEITAIRSASAAAVNPTQAAQVEVQMLTLLWEQMVKGQRLLGLRISEEAQHDLSEASRSQQQLQYEQSLVQSIQKSADFSPPHFTDDQINAITAPATFKGQ